MCLEEAPNTDFKVIKNDMRPGGVYKIRKGKLFLCIIASVHRISMISRYHKHWQWKLGGLARCFYCIDLRFQTKLKSEMHQNLPVATKCMWVAHSLNQEWFLATQQTILASLERRIHVKQNLKLSWYFSNMTIYLLNKYVFAGVSLVMGYNKKQIICSNKTYASKWLQWTIYC